MNDTFDDLTFSNIINSQEKCVLSDSSRLNCETRGEPEKNQNDISFDDSLFLNSQEFTILKNLENVSEKNCTNIKDCFSENISSCETLVKDIDRNASVGDIGNENTSIGDIFSDSCGSMLETMPKSPSQTETIPQSPSMPKSPSQTTLKLSSWGLPATILEKYTSRNITSMLPWQAECLNNPQILKKHSNLVYSAPTSAGKTLVAEILAIKTVLERSKKVIFILPFVSVVREKMFYFQDIFSGSGVRVDGFMGSYNPPGGFQAVQFAVCTIEKANSLINSFLQAGSLSEIGAVIIDEMHLLGEPNRGYLLELLLTKLKYIILKDHIDLQIIGMSATLPNLETLSKWLEAELYVTNFRPIPLHEHASVCGDIYDSTFTKVRQLRPLPDLDTDTDNILQLCLETITSNCSVLIFCPTKNWCENLAQQISTAFYKLGSGQSQLSRDLRQQLSTDNIVELLEQLKRCPVGLDEILRRTVSFGVAYHHAGLTLDERDIIEGGFRNGVVRVLVATSTLSSGVNLPARRVIIRTPVFHGKPLNALTYRQMIGRAGRMGKDTSGESILICQKHEEKIARKLMSEALEPIESCLEGEGKLKRAILEIVASGVASSVDDVTLFTKCTLLAQTETYETSTDEALDFLVKNEFLRVINEDNLKRYVATSLGKACLSSSIPPEDGLALFTELEKARQCFVLESELHLIYLVTPYSACYQWGNIDWMFYLNLWEKLPLSMKKVGELVGVREGYLVSATRGKLQTNSSKLHHKFLVHKRFFIALALQDLVNEKPLSEVCAKFSCNRGMLQNLQLTASTFAGMVTSFSKQLGWSSVEILISQFQERLHFGVSRELLDLMKLPILNGKSARALYNNGMESLVQIANSDVDTIESILQRVMPFQSGKQREGESESAMKERNKLRNIWITGKEGLTEREAAELILKSSREFLRMEMGLKEAKWEEEERKPEEILPDEEKKLSGASLDKKLNWTSDSSLFESSITETTPQKNISLNSSGDFITTSQDETFLTPNPPRKRIRKRKENILTEESPRKKTKIFREPLRIKANLLEESLKIDSTALEIVDVCTNEILFNTFCSEAKNQKYLSLAVACSETNEKKRLIGLTPIEKTNEEFAFKNRKVEGFAVNWDGVTSYYLDISKIKKSIDFIKLLNNKTVIMFDSKEQMKVLKKCCGIDFSATIEDPKVADWLLEPESSEKKFEAMVRVYCPEFFKLSQWCISRTWGSPSLDVKSSIDSRMRSSVECFLSWHLIDALKKELSKQNSNFLKVYTLEMSCLRTLAKMELEGVVTNKLKLVKLVEILNSRQKTLEQKVFSLAGRRFSLASSKDLSKILNLRKTTKQVLQNHENPISGLVLEWRKIHSIVTKTLQPLIRSIENGRIYGCCMVHTATGRITMHEPNLQNVSRNFTIDGKEISCRDAFLAGDGKIFVSADYCQLELRLLAHLSQDEVLCKIMRSRGDVFKSVAAKWNKINENEVTDNLRQHAKQICYGIIYGMGSKTLSEQLCIDEKQATIFMETFKNAYPGVQKYIQDVVEKCQKNGFVETLSGRRRYLPHINNRNLVMRSQAERQAVNTTIQGSAADIVKKTMVDVEEKSSEMKNSKLVLHLHDELIYEVSKNDLKTFVPILKSTMEDSVKLSIPFPVKVKVGPSWGQLTEYIL